MSRQNAADALKWLWNRCTAPKAQNASAGSAKSPEQVYGIGPMIAALQAIKDYDALSPEQKRVVIEHCRRIIELEERIDAL